MSKSIEIERTESCQYCQQIDFLAVLSKCRQIRWDEVDSDYRPSKHRDYPTKLKGVSTLGFESKWEENCAMCEFLSVAVKRAPLFNLSPLYSLHAFCGRNFYDVLRERGSYADLCSWPQLRDQKQISEHANEDFFVFMVGLERIGWALKR